MYTGAKMKISIFGGAGTVGSCTAFAIAERGLADEIVMLDINTNVLMNHVMDISVAGQLNRDTIVRAGNTVDISGSDMVIVAIGIPSLPGKSEIEFIKDGFPIIKDIVDNIGKYCKDAVVITATNPVDSWNYAAFLAGIQDRSKLIGYNFNDSLRFRIAIAGALKIKPSRVEAIVAGIHPEAQVLLSSTVKVDGKLFRMDEVLSRRVREEAINYLKKFTSWQGGRTAGWTTASGLANIVAAIVADSGSVMACSVIVDGEYGYRDISLGLPVAIVRKGIHHIVEVDLLNDDKAELDRVAGIMAGKAAAIREIPSLKSK